MTGAENGVKNFSELHKGSGGLKRLDLFDHRLNREALHQPGELVRPDGHGFGGVARPTEAAVLDTLGKQQETVPFPDEPFDAVSTPAAEKEQCIGYKERQVVAGLDDRGKAVDTKSEICKTAHDIDRGEV